MSNMQAGYTIFNQIDELKNEVNTELMETPVSPQSPIDQFVWIRKGGGRVGETTKFALRLWANDAEDRSPYEEIPGRKPVIAQFQVSHREKVPDAEVIPRWTKITDLYDLFKDDISPAMLARINVRYAREIAELIGQGTVATTVYDDKPFFVDTDIHESGPGRSDAPPFKNWLRNNKLDEDGLLAAVELIETMPAPDKNDLDLPGELLCICSTRSQYHRALRFYRGENVATAVGASAAASQSNSLDGLVRPVYLKQLRKYYTGAGGKTGDAWCVVKVASAKHRPFILSFAEDGEPEIYTEGLSPSDHNRVTRSISRVGYRGGWGTGYLWPQLAVLSTETT